MLVLRLTRWRIPENGWRRSIVERFPLSGSLPRDAELLKSGYRYVIAGQYLCVYRLIVDTVFVYHIVHGASNYPVLFKRLLQEELKRED